MADAVADKVHKTRPRAGRSAHIIANGVTVYAGMLVQAESGYANHWDETGAFLGIILGEGDGLGIDNTPKTGDTSASVPPTVRVDESGVILQHVAVGGTPSQANVEGLVYCPDSDVANLTVTDTTNPPVGILKKFRSVTDCDVQLFTPAEHAAGVADATWNS